MRKVEVGRYVAREKWDECGTEARDRARQRTRAHRSIGVRRTRKTVRRAWYNRAWYGTSVPDTA
eukprot:1934637-Rhodomonas_salina.2